MSSASQTLIGLAQGILTKTESYYKTFEGHYSFVPKPPLNNPSFGTKLMRPQKYKNLGPTERMRVPLYKQITILCNLLDRKAEEGCDAVEIVDSFIESINN